MKSKGPLTFALILSIFAAEFLIGADEAKKPESSPAPAAVTTSEGAPAGGEGEIPAVVAVVEGAEISKVELERALAAIMAQQGRNAGAIPPQQKPTLYRMVLDDLIVDRIIAKRSAATKVGDAEVDGTIEKLKKNFGTEEEFTAQLVKVGQTAEALRENIRSNLRQQRWVEEQIKGKDEVADAEVTDFYSKNPDQFKSPEKVRASHILVAVPQDAKPESVKEKEETAKAILERVKKGEDFAKVAEEASEDPSAKQNKGDLDFFGREQMVPEFADAAFKMKEGEVSAEPVRSQFGYHVIKLTGRKDAEIFTLEKARPQLLSYLKNQKKQKEIEKVVRALRENAEVKVNLPEVKPPAEASAPAEAAPAAGK